MTRQELNNRTITEIETYFEFTIFKNPDEYGITYPTIYKTKKNAIKRIIHIMKTDPTFKPIFSEIILRENTIYKQIPDVTIISTSCPINRFGISENRENLVISGKTIKE